MTKFQITRKNPKNPKIFQNIPLKTIHLLDKFYQEVFSKLPDQEIRYWVNEETACVVVSACMLLASKYDEIYPAPVDDFLFLFKEQFGKNCSRSKFVNIEIQILTMLNWNFSYPTPYTLLRTMAICLRFGESVHLISKLILDTIVLNCSTCHYSPSISTIIWGCWGNI